MTSCSTGRMGISGSIIEPGHHESLPSARNSANRCLPKVFSGTEVRGLSASNTAVGQAYQINYQANFERNRLADLNLTQVPTAFRKIPGGKSNIDHAKEVFDFVEQNRPCVALAFDVEKFFDTLSHRKLRTAWASVLGSDRLPPDHYRVFRSLTRFAWVSRKAAYDEFGISEYNPKLREPNPRRARICLPEEFRKHIREAGRKDIEPLRKGRIDLISVSGHKIFAPKGIGALILRRRGYDRPPLKPLFYGGGQERGLRPGTLPVAHVAALGMAAETAMKHHEKRRKHCRKIKDAALAAFSSLSPRIHGRPDETMDHVLNLGVSKDRLRGPDRSAQGSGGDF